MFCFLEAGLGVHHTWKHTSDLKLLSSICSMWISQGEIYAKQLKSITNTFLPDINVPQRMNCYIFYTPFCFMNHYRLQIHWFYTKIFSLVFGFQLDLIKKSTQSLINYLKWCHLIKRWLKTVWKWNKSVYVEKQTTRRLLSTSNFCNN